ncbi:MobA/MobL family protein [Psychrobacter sp. AOP7-D2-23]|uniref:MobA/MobL family protein n=6 Tax=Psychrobacter TaxID=497 RepID=UPI00186A335D|nr:MobA/MobL family protein [Psychrobacter sp. FME60]
MAIGRLSVGIGKKGKASPHAKYIAREGKYAKPSYHEEKLENTGHGNMPKWAEHNPNDFWQMADKHERKNGSTYREHVIALPRELDEYKRHELIKDWIAQEIGEKHAYQYAIHNPPALDGDEQPHAHIMFSERTIDGVERDPDQYFKRYNSKNPEKGGAKKANTPKFSAERKEELKAMRDRWEQMCNAHLEREFRSERISMKSLKEQGIEREPINLTMAQLKQPEIKEAYLDLLAAKNDDFMAELDVWMEFYDDNLEYEIKHQLAQKDEAERQAQEQQEAEREAERQAQEQQEAEREAERNVFKENNKIFSNYAEKTETTAKAILDSQLQGLRNEGAPLLAKFEKLRDNKPWRGKEKWAKDKQNALNAYVAVKDKYNSLNDKGVTDEHREQAKKYIAKTEPSYHAKAQQAIEILQEFKRAAKDEKAKQHGADFHAQQGKSYTGKILRADDNGIVQQTRNGIVYHPAMSGIEQGKSYYLENNGNTYNTREEYQVRTPNKSIDQDRGIVR